MAPTELQQQQEICGRDSFLPHVCENVHQSPALHTLLRQVRECSLQTVFSVSILSLWDYFTHQVIKEDYTSLLISNEGNSNQESEM